MSIPGIIASVLGTITLISFWVWWGRKKRVDVAARRYSGRALTQAEAFSYAQTQNDASGCLLATVLFSVATLLMLAWLLSGGSVRRFFYLIFGGTAALAWLGILAIATWSMRPGVKLEIDDFAPWCVVAGFISLPFWAMLGLLRPGGTAMQHCMHLSAAISFAALPVAVSLWFFMRQTRHDVSDLRNQAIAMILVGLLAAGAFYLLSLIPTPQLPAV